MDVQFEPTIFTEIFVGCNVKKKPLMHLTKLQHLSVKMQVT